MESLPVTLIVKAPNQQFEDQTIKCEPTWSIRKLKGHLSEVYPCNPRMEEQKLIYSGQLLNDSHILKDVLRQYEGQEAHTFHLVYTPKNQTRPTSQSSQSSRNGAGTTGNPQTSQPQQSIGSDGLRQRITSTTSNTTNAASSSTAPVTQPPTPPFANPFGYMPNAFGLPAPQPAHITEAQQQLVAQQMAVQSMMQQMYVQYMSQMAAYSQQWQNAAASGQAQPPTFVPQPFNLQHVNVPNVEQTPLLADAQGTDQAAHVPAAAANAANAAAAARPAAQAAGDDEPENRDWLETLYTLSRLAILMSLVYFYSSPGRCSIVIICIGLYYWYQHHQRNQRQQQTDQGHDGDADVIDNTERDNDANADQNAPPPEIDAANTPNASTGSSDTTRATSSDSDENRLTTMALLRTFISSFFASLIPETPAV